jgi:hypothetical protein
MLLVSAMFWCQRASDTSLSLTIGSKGELLGSFSGTSIVLARNADTRELSSGASIAVGAESLTKELGLRKATPESTNISRANSVKGDVGETSGNVTSFKRLTSTTRTRAQWRPRLEGTTDLKGY